MPQIPIIMPQLGEAIAEATVVALHIQEGDNRREQDVIEVETNKATMNVSSPCPGKVGRLLVKLRKAIRSARCWAIWKWPTRMRGVWGWISTAPPGRPARAGRGQRGGTRDEARKRSVQPTVRGLPVPAHAAGASYMSPRMKARMAELGLHAADLAGVAGSGAGGASPSRISRNFWSSWSRTN